VSWLHPVAAEEVPPVVLLKKIRALLSNHPWQHEVRYSAFRLSFM
jgi:hypothetical protein